MKLHRLFSRRRAKPQRPKVRRLGMEHLEPKALVAGDIFSMGAAPLFGLDSLLNSNAALSQQLNLDTAQIDVRLKITDTNGIAITQIKAGQDFILQVWVQDVRPGASATGVSAAYTDITYDSSMFSPVGSIVHGDDFKNGTSGNNLTPGLLDEAGGFQTNFSPLGAAEHMLFSQQMHVDAAANGNTSFMADPADNLPSNDSIVDPATTVPTSQVGYGGISLLVVGLPNLSSASVQQAEGDSGDSTMMFTVNLASAATETTTVDFATVDGTATAGSDYTAANGKLTFNVGESSKSFNVAVHGDSTHEQNEQFSVVFSNATGAIAPAAVTGTILNDDAIPQISVNDISPVEGDVGTSPANFVISLSNASDQAVSVGYTFAPGTAAAGTDYEAVDGTVMFAPGETSKQVQVGVVGDTIYEGNQTFTIALQNPVAGEILKGTGTATIVENDALPQLTVNDPTPVTEPSGGTTTMTFTVTLSAATEVTTTVDWATADNSTVENQDYVAASGSLTFLPGETTKTINITILDDNLNEAQEQFVIALSNATNATLPLFPLGVGNILDDGDAAPTVSIEGLASVLEGDSGVTAYTFNVVLSGPSGQNVIVNYTTVNGSAIGGVDYETNTGSVEFEPGVVTMPVTVNVIGNTADQVDRTFSVQITSVEQASVNNGEAIGTIIDDDDPPILSVLPVSILEGDVGTKTLTFTVSLSAASGKTITVDYATAGDTATEGTDYNGVNGMLTFAPGVTSQTIEVQIIGDTDIESVNESFTLNLSNAVNATPANLQTTGTIRDNDGFVVTLSDAQVEEGDSGAKTMTFDVTLSRAAEEPLTVDWATSAGTATAGLDYQTASGTVTFATGATTATIIVNILGDTLDEDDETLLVTLSNASYGAIGNEGPATGTIVDNDVAPAVSITGGSIIEGNSGTKTQDFTVTLAAASSKTITMDYATADGTATAGTDYVTNNGTLTFAPGETSKTISVVINGDNEVESDETYTVGLSNLVNATAGTTQATGTIRDDDGFIVTVANASTTESDTGTTQLVFTLTLARPAVGPLTVTYVTAPGTATSSGTQKDFELAAGQVTFADGETTATVSVTVNGDTIDEDDETMQLVVTNPTYGTVTGSPATGTIIDNDAAPTMSIASASSAEGDATGNPVNFVVTLSAASGKTITVNYATAGGTATEGTDYTAAAGMLTFAPGETTKTITVNTIGDTKTEDDETFTVNLAGETNATIPGSRSATGTILDDETPTLTITNSSVIEGSEGTTQMKFTVTLSKASSTPVIVKIDTADGTAIAGVDYQATSGDLTIEPGETERDFGINIGGDKLNEDDETFTVKLSNARGATIATPEVTGTIIDDDPVPQLFVSDPAPVAEGDTGVRAMTFQVFLLAASGRPVTVNYSTADGTAVAGSDYQATSGALTFAPGETFKSITVNVIGDQVIEATEAFSLNLTATNATFFTGGGATRALVGTITDDDSPGSFSGHVYQDTNDDGIFSGVEAPLPGVTLMLSGIDSLGNTVVRYTTSAADGSYSFSNIPKGTFTVTETNPSGYLDGEDTAGAGVSKPAGVNDQFLFTMSGGQSLTGNNFGERGIPPTAIYKGMLSGSRTNPK